MKSITVRRLDLQFDADQITHGPVAARVDRAILLTAPPELIEALTQAERSLGEMLGLAQVFRGERVLHESQAADQIRATDALNTTRAAIKKARGEE